ncbi:MAG TPA: c-type cytochrome biogenesis protein CcmI [Brevundimonas sp.]|jgi:cytochrome c-type biogenesis protein CcmH|uniref:c-type cytochrome biogenesis protein CcmI n=1 Tax=Brevundimonas sp. TaxID=1871086 RepID=UPI002C6D1A7F|nr:c-type cytochrome biogenesis protein CcmI [Brevundimonas sp.]HRH20177.1 c-type cytochrome biogenesis protein CcmI [Brevundimonas sp.]
MIWLVLITMALLAAAAILIPFIRPETATDPALPTRPLALRDRLAEIDKQAADGELSEAEASALRLEAQRRVLAEARSGEAEARPLGPQARKVVGGLSAVLIVIGGVGLYGLLGRPDLARPEAEVAASGDTSLERMITALEGQVRETPDDAEMWGILGGAYAQAGRYDSAAGAYARAAVLNPEDARLHSALGETLVQVAEGVVTDDAMVAFGAAVARDPSDPRARYFLALRKDQTGDRDGAMDDWIALLNSAPPDAPWVPQVRALVDQVAAERGLDVSGRITGSGGDGSPGS